MEEVGTTAHRGEKEDRRGCAMIGCRRRGHGKAVLAGVTLRRVRIQIVEEEEKLWGGGGMFQGRLSPWRSIYDVTILPRWHFSTTELI
jgi:hypothetical protein